MTVRIGIAGIGGRLGREVAAAIADTSHAFCAGGLVRPGRLADTFAPDGVPLFDDARRLASAADVLIDVSAAGAVAAHAEAAAEAGIALVVGVTGLDAAAEAALDRTARRVPVLVAANFAPGVALVVALARALAAACPGAEYDAEILETHHRHKRDAPSGTALAIGRAVAEGRGVSLDAVAERGRDGDTGPRGEGAVGFASLRSGAVVGEHTLSFTSGNEQIVLAHRAFDRAVFGQGAVRAALWLAGRPPGRHGMAEALGLPAGSLDPSRQTT